jgi:tRNA-specific 2-thiouridylase
MGDERTKVVAAMSGGVDSSTAAALLKEQGFDVTGVTLRLPSYGDAPPDAPCCGVNGIEDARRVAGKLGIPFYVLDFRKEFEQSVVADFCRAYSEGRTPNPCVRCNERVKFGGLLTRAQAFGADFVATGHYVAKETDAASARIGLHMGRADDDQSYFLFSLSQEQLRHALFPLGSYSKDEVRRMARERGLPVHDKPGSQDLCFLPQGRYRDFLRSRCPEAFRPGLIVHVSGEVLGRHEGIGAYTVGQRRGLGIASREPLYVVALRPERNEVVVGEEAHTHRGEVTAGEANWVSVPPPREALSARVKIRYNHPGAPAEVTPVGDGRVRIVFSASQAAPCPGQAAVFYRDDVLLGGGTIEG